MAAVMVDTSAIFALLDRSDRNHVQAVRILQRLAKDKEGVLLTNFILAETHALVLARLGAEMARAWLQNLRWPVEKAIPEKKTIPDFKTEKEAIASRNRPLTSCLGSLFERS